MDFGRLRRFAIIAGRFSPYGMYFDRFDYATKFQKTQAPKVEKNQKNPNKKFTCLLRAFAVSKQVNQTGKMNSEN
jgi:hypothetical protein